MNILLTNDDGIMSPGLIELAYALQKKHNVYIVAPETEQSAKSQAITIKSEMQVKKHDIKGIVNDAFSLSGTPADCVRVALDVLYKDEIDLVFSGTNRGLNAGADITAPEEPFKDGYTFVGWNPELPATMPAENLVVKAKWEKVIEEYTITFNSDGGSEDRKSTRLNSSH